MMDRAYLAARRSLGGRALVIGEALVDVVRRGDAVEAHPGGSPLNVAIGLQRLGVEALLHSSFGRDNNGALIGRHLAASGVEVTAPTIGDGATSVATATIQADGSASYDFAIDWDVAELPAAFGAVDLVHTGSIGAALEPGAGLVLEAVMRLRGDAIVSFDPNIRPVLMGRHARALKRVHEFVSVSDVVKASDEDLAWLYPGESVESVLERWLERGPGLVVATLGEGGALALSRSGRMRVSAPPTEVVDTIGAGDSFMAGLLAALTARGLTGAAARGSLAGIGSEGLREVVGFAVECAAVTVSRAGANPPTLDEVRPRG